MKEVAKADRADNKAKIIDGSNQQSHNRHDDQLDDGAFIQRAEEEFKRKPVIPKSIFAEVTPTPRNPSARSRLAPAQSSRERDFLEKSMAHDSLSGRSQVSQVSYSVARLPQVPSGLGQRFASQPRPTSKALNSLSSSDSDDQFTDQ